MKILLTIILSLIGFTNWAQAAFEDEQFINSVYLQFGPDSMKDYFLSDERVSIRIDKDNQKRIQKELGEFVPDSILEELFYIASIDTSDEKWDCSLVHNSKCISKDSSNIVFRRQFVLTQNSKWSIRKKAREERKQLKAELKRTSEIPGLYSLSRPIFDKSRGYALLNYHYSCGVTCGRSCLFLFKKVGNKWIKLKEANCYMS